MPSAPSWIPGVVAHVLALAHDAGRVPARGLLALVFIVVVGAAGLSSGFGPDANWASPGLSIEPAIQPSAEQVAAVPVASPPAVPLTTPKLAGGPFGETTRAVVIRVIDGDTILVAFGGARHEVQYLGVQAPTTMKARASAANKALVAGQAVVLEAGVSDSDRSGRLLRYVWVHRGSTWTLVNLELVRRGFAMPAAHPSDTKYVDRYAAAEREARGLHAGLWGPAPRSKVSPKATPRPPTPRPTPKPPKAG
jgi:micrococcal nuclease